MRNGEKIFYKDDYTVWVGKYEGVVVNQVEPYSYIKYKEGDEPIELRVAANRPVEEGFEKAYDWSYNEGVDFMPYCFQITKDLDLGDWTNVRLKEGSIIKKGGFIGGSGYNADSAPNTTCTTIENCYVRGSIKG